MGLKYINSMKSKKTLFAFVIIGLLGVGLVFFFSNKKEKGYTTEQTALEIPFNKQGELAFLSGQTNDTISVIDIEVADNDQRRARGLMYRASMPEYAGMFFVHDVEDIQSFWMKNTYLSLDMIFVNQQKEIVTIHAGTEPLKEWNYTSTAPALYVVEVNGGYCAKHNVKVGDKITYSLK